MNVKVEWSFIIFIHGILLSMFFMESECGQCPRIELKNGIVKYRQARLARFQCRWRFELMGEKYITCKNGEWDSKIPVCVKPGCPKFPSLKNGLDYYFKRDAAVMFFCSPGFELVGDRQLYCNGEKWNGTQPICKSAETAETILSCTFEQEDLCGWAHDPLHDFDWKKQNRKTPSGHIGTGPSYDHTLGADKDGYYMYIESSSRLENDTARLLSPLYPASYSKNGCFVFYYHMYGRTTGTLRLYVRPQSVEFGAILKDPFLQKKYVMFEKNGNQGNYWYRGFFDLDEYNDNFQIVIEGVRGPGYVSDIAIDDVAILQNEKCVEQKKEHYAATAIPVTVKDSCLNRCDNSATKADNGEVIECQCNLKCLDENNCCPDYRDFCIFDVTTDAETYANSTTYHPPMLPTSQMMVATNSYTVTTVKSTTVQITTSTSTLPTTKTTSTTLIIPTRKTTIPTRKPTNAPIVPTTKIPLIITSTTLKVVVPTIPSINTTGLMTKKTPTVNQTQIISTNASTPVKNDNKTYTTATLPQQMTSTTNADVPTSTLATTAVSKTFYHYGKSEDGSNYRNDSHEDLSKSSNKGSYSITTLILIVIGGLVMICLVAYAAKIAMLKFQLKNIVMPHFTFGQSLRRTTSTMRFLVQDEELEHNY